MLINSKAHTKSNLYIKQTLKFFDESYVGHIYEIVVI